MVDHMIDGSMATPLRYQRHRSAGGGEREQISFMFRISCTHLGPRVPTAPNSPRERPLMFLPQKDADNWYYLLLYDTNINMIVFDNLAPGSFQPPASSVPASQHLSIQHAASSSVASSLEDSNYTTDGTHRNKGRWQAERTTKQQTRWASTCAPPNGERLANRGERLPVGVAIRLPITELRERRTWPP